VNSIKLKNGSNTFAVVVARSGLDTPSLHMALTTILGGGLGVKPEFVGAMKSTGENKTFWVGGLARPITVWLLPVTPKRVEWYEKLGSPVGNDPEFLSVCIDWRGSDKTIQWDDKVFHAVGTVVRGAEAWPDGDAATIRARLKSADSDAWLSELATDLTTGVEAVSDTVADAAEKVKKAVVPTALWIALGAAATWWFLSRRQ